MKHSLFITLLTFIVWSFLSQKTAVKACSVKFNDCLEDIIGVADFRYTGKIQRQFSTLWGLTSNYSKWESDVCPKLLNTLECMYQQPCFARRSPTNFTFVPEAVHVTVIQDFLFFACFEGKHTVEKFSQCNDEPGFKKEFVNCFPEETVQLCHTDYVPFECLRNISYLYNCTDYETMKRIHIIFAAPFLNVTTECPLYDQTAENENELKKPLFSANCFSYQVGMCYNNTSADPKVFCTEKDTIRKCLDNINCNDVPSAKSLYFAGFDKTTDYLCNKQEHDFIQYKDCLMDPHFYSYIETCLKLKTTNLPNTEDLYCRLYQDRWQCLGNIIDSFECGNKEVIQEAYSLYAAPVIDIFLQEAQCKIDEDVTGGVVTIGSPRFFIAFMLIINTAILKIIF